MPIRDSQRKLAKGSLITFAASGLLVLIRLTKNGVMSRILGPAARGVLGMVVFLADFLASLGELGFGAAVVYFVAKENTSLRKTLGGIFVFTIFAGGAFAACGAAVLSIDYLFKDDISKTRDYATLIILAIPLLILQRLTVSLLLAKGLIKTLNGVWLMESALPLILFLAIWRVAPEFPLNAAVAAWFVGICSVSAVILLIIKRHGAYPPTFDSSHFIKSIKYGASSYFANIFIKILRRMDYLFIAAMFGAKELGYYAIATAMAEMLLLLPESIAVPFVPLVFGMNKKDSERFTPTVLRIVFAVMLLACGAVLIFGKLLLLLIFGEAYLPSLAPLVWLLPGVVGLAIFPILRADLFRRNKPATVSALTSGALAVNFILNCILIPKWGISGAAISSSIAYLMAAALVYIYYCRLSKNSILGTLLIKPSEIRLMYAAAMEKVRGAGR